MKKLALISSILLVFLLGSTAQAQEKGQKVRGVVIDAFTQSTLIGATVVLLDENQSIVKGAVTNSKGEFLLEEVPYGRHSFEIRYLGYKKSLVSNIMVGAGKEVFLRIKLEAQLNSLKEVVISSTIEKKKPLNEMALSSARVFSKDETERFAGSLGDPARMAGNYAGVSSANDSRNDIVIRGNSPSGLLWRLDDIEIGNPNHFGAQGATGGPVSMLNSNLLSNSDFFTGAFPAEYGNALSGVFDINLRSGNREKYEGLFQVGFNGFEGALEGPMGIGESRGSFIACYRYSTLQLISKLGFDLGLGSAIPKYQDLTLIGEIPTQKIGTFRLTSIWGRNAISLGRGFDQEGSMSVGGAEQSTAIDFSAALTVVNLTHQIPIDTKGFVKTGISIQQSHSQTILDTIDYTNQQYLLRYAGSLDENRIPITSQLKYRLNEHNSLVAGVNAMVFITNFQDSAYIHYRNSFAPVFSIENKVSCLYQSYAMLLHKFNEKLVLNAGIHGQLYDLSQEFVIEPRVSMRQNIGEKQAVSFAYGLHSQIQTRLAYFYKNTDEEDFPNLHLKSSRSHHFVVGYDLSFTENFRLKIESYYQHLFQIPISKTEPQFSMINEGANYYMTLPDSLINEGLGRNMGVELTLEKFFSSGYYALGTLSLFDSKTRAYDGVWRNSAFNNQFILNILGGYEWKLGKKDFLNINLRSVWAGGNFYTPIDLDASIVKGETVRDMNRAFSEKQDNYFRMDIRIAYKQNLGKLSQEWAVDLQNITNHKNIFSISYNPTSQKIVRTYQQAFLPMVTYRVMF